VNPEREKYLNLRTKPGKVTSEEAGWHLGFSVREICILIAAGMLKPLGNPAENAIKFFLSWELDQLNRDRAWFDKACHSVTKYWKDRNLQRVTLNAKKRWPHRFVSGGKTLKPKPRAVRPKPPKHS
jgi:hypothetical protein